MMLRRIGYLYVCIMTLLFLSVEQLQAEKCFQRYYEKKYRGASLSSSDIISSHRVNSEVLCFDYCLKVETCVGFNYKEEPSDHYTKNCQLSQSQYDDIKEDGHGNGEWVYFQDTQRVSLDVKNHTKNNTIIQENSKFLLDNLEAGVEMKIWFNITENSLDKLYNDPRYPDNPDNVTILSSFDTGQNKGDYYGCKLSALYQPLETGNYTFSVACDNTCDVFWGEMMNNTNQKKIISLRMTTGYGIWDKTPIQKSKPLYMEKDRFYKIEAILKEGWRADYLILGLQQPNGTFIAPIPSNQLFYEL